MTDLQTQLNEKLTALILPKSQLTVTKTQKPAESQFHSHFNGDPYFEAGEQWPVNTQTGQPLEFIFQIVNDGTLQLPSEIGVFQFYHDYHGDDFIVDGDQTHGYQVKIYSKIDMQRMQLVSRPVQLPGNAYHSIGFRTKNSLPDWDELTYFDQDIKRLCEVVNPKNSIRTYREFVKQTVGEQTLGSWLGGYAQWLQGAYPRGKFLMQIDSEADFMWGDSGVLYFYYQPGDLSSIGFELQCC